MLAKRIIACLDVKSGQVVKGIQFRNHEIVGDILNLAEIYCHAGADELVFYDITASSDLRTVDRQWINQIAKRINIPFCVAGGIRTVDDAVTILNDGADKISINSPALENPQFIEQLVKRFGSQCVVIGIDSLEDDGQYWVCQYTGDEKKMRRTAIKTEEWVKEVQQRGAGEIVLNCMNYDGVRSGYDLKQLQQIRQLCQIPLIASGGAGEKQHFFDVFNHTQVDGALAASVFHRGVIEISSLKHFLREKNIRMRI